MNARSKIALRLTPLGRYYAILVTGIFLAAMVRQVNLLLLLAGVIAGPLFLSWLLTRRNLAHLSVKRRMPSRVCANDLLVVDLEVVPTSPRSRSWLVSVTDRITRGGNWTFEEKEAPRVLLPYVDGSAKAVATYRGRAFRRGEYVFGPLTLTTRFPLGLFEARREIPATHEMLVYPRLGRLTDAWFRRHQFDYEGGTRSERCADRICGDFYGLREWQPGDSPRLVHWRSSARHGELLVRQFDRPRQQHLTVILNLWRKEAARDGDPTPPTDEQIEKAVSFVGTVIHDACRKGGRSILLGVAGAEPTWLSGVASSGLLERALEILARVEPTEQDRLRDLLREARRKSPPRADILLITTRAVRRRQNSPGSGGRDVSEWPKGHDSTLHRRPLSLSGRHLEVIDVIAGDLDPIFDDEPRIAT